MFHRRGFRKVESLSPCLFLFFTEGFSGLPQRAINDGSIHDARVSRYDATLFHLFFVNDSIVFTFVTKDERIALKPIFEKYASFTAK